MTVGSLPTRPFVDSLENGTAAEGSQPWFWATRTLLALRTRDADAAFEYVNAGGMNSGPCRRICVIK